MVFRAWQSKLDGVDKVKLVEKEGDPEEEELAENEVVVAIEAVALNYRDAEVAEGLYKHHRATAGGAAEPITLCSDSCSTILRAGPKVSRFQPGDRVLSTFNQTHIRGQVKAEHMLHGLGLPQPGVLCNWRKFPEHGLVRAPQGWSPEIAACLPIAGVTAWSSLKEGGVVGNLDASKREGSGEGGRKIVLVQGTGGVAMSALLLAKAAGAQVFVISSSDEKLRRAKELGADWTVNYRTTEDWDRVVNEVTEEEGVDIILETAGAKTLRRSFDAIAFGGVIAAIGYVSGKEDDEGDRTNVNLLALRKNVTLKGILNGSRDDFEELVSFVEEKGLKERWEKIVDRVFRFEEADKALQHLWSGGHFGKVVVKVKEE